MKGGRVVKGIQFEGLRDAGDPVEFAQFYEKEGADELVFLDISATLEKRKTMVNLAKKVADVISIPFCVGGGIASIEDAQLVLDAGADKISINSAAVRNPDLLREISQKYGSKCLVLAIDAKRVEITDNIVQEDKNIVQINQKPYWFDVVTHGGTRSTGMDAINWAKRATQLGVGEILPTSKDFDGVKNGYDLELTRGIAEASNLPVIASGGAGTLKHILEAFTLGKATGALAASIFHFREITITQAKKYCMDHGIEMNMTYLS